MAPARRRGEAARGHRATILTATLALATILRSSTRSEAVRRIPRAAGRLKIKQLTLWLAFVGGLSTAVKANT
jgi:hypothetical protein